MCGNRGFFRSGGKGGVQSEIQHPKINATTGNPRKVKFRCKLERVTSSSGDRKCKVVKAEKSKAELKKQKNLTGLPAMFCWEKKRNSHKASNGYIPIKR